MEKVEDIEQVDLGGDDQQGGPVDEEGLLASSDDEGDASEHDSGVPMDLCRASGLVKLLGGSSPPEESMEIESVLLDCVTVEIRQESTEAGKELVDVVDGTKEGLTVTQPEEIGVVSLDAKASANSEVAMLVSQAVVANSAPETPKLGSGVEAPKGDPEVMVTRASNDAASADDANAGDKVSADAKTLKSEKCKGIPVFDVSKVVMLS